MVSVEFYSRSRLSPVQRDYWINVYEHHSGEGVTYGRLHFSRDSAIDGAYGVNAIFLIYRLHVKVKP